MGDSITQGWDGHKQVDNPIPNELGKLAGFDKVENLSVGGTTMTGSKGLPSQVRSVNFADYDYALISFGTNDYWQQSESLQDMQNGLQQAINKMREENPKIQILITTPIQGWENNTNSLDQKNTMGVSQSDIDDMILSVARLNNLKVNDWRNNPIVTSDNYKLLLGDQMVHPTQATMDLMANRYFQAFFNGQKVTINQDDQPDNPSEPDHQPVVLEMASVSGNWLGTFNDNFQKIFQALVDYSTDDNRSIEWQKKDFKMLNRGTYVYLVKTFELIKQVVDEFLGSEDIYAKSFVPHSELSAKTRIKKLDRKEALDKIMQDDMYTYQFKEDVRDGVSKRYASFIIDNIHDVAQYTEPEEFLSANGKGRDDGTQLAYLIAAVQYQQEQIEELKKKLEEK